MLIKRAVLYVLLIVLMVEFIVISFAAMWNMYTIIPNYMVIAWLHVVLLLGSVWFIICSGWLWMFKWAEKEA